MAKKRKRQPRALSRLPAGKAVRVKRELERERSGVLAASTWGGLFVCSFLAALFLAWHLLAMADFFYGVWYDVLAIDETVAEYGPQNRNRDGFGNTDKAEHERLFGAIVTAIHNNGAGLEALQYRDPQRDVITNFLTEPEIVHLRDVAALITKVNVLGATSLAIVSTLLALILVCRLPPPSLSRFHTTATVVATVVIALTLNFGAEQTFYVLHELLFPPEHQWFFYYRDSLMSTFMQAPNLFGYIAVALLVLALLLYVTWVVGLTQTLRRYSRRG